MQKLLIFNLIAVVILSMSSFGIVDAFIHFCFNDNCCKSWQKCDNYICSEDAKCDPECRDDLRCFTINHKDVCRCQAGYKLQKNSTTKCERDPQCNGFRRMFFCSYNATTWNYTVEIGR